MSECIYCHEPCGWFAKHHGNCASLHAANLLQLQRLAAVKATEGAKWSASDSEISHLVVSGFLSKEDVDTAAVLGLSDAIDQALDDNLLSQDEESRLTTFMNNSGVPRERYEATEGFRKMVMGATLRDLTEGKIPQRCAVSGPLPNLAASEAIIWAFPEVQLGEIKVHRQYVGASQGFSFRVLPRIYYRVGQFHGQPIESSQMEVTDRGALFMTNLNMVFVGQNKSVKLPFKKIVNFKPFSDGIGVVRDGANSKMFYLLNGNGWFIYNLAVGISQLPASEASRKNQK